MGGCLTLDWIHWQHLARTETLQMWLDINEAVLGGFMQVVECFRWQLMSGRQFIGVVSLDTASFSRTSMAVYAALCTDPLGV